MTQTTIKSRTITDKKNYVNNMFNSIAYKYDLLNNLMTFGTHKLWKKEMINLALKELKESKNALDLCSGTADLSIILSQCSPNTKIICIDNSKNMIDIAKEKIKKLNLTNISLELNDAESIKEKKLQFDLITIGFGLRNLTNKEACLEMIYNSLLEGGVFACIDLGYPTNPFWRSVYFYYFFKLVPILGSLFAKNKEAYNYLPESLTTWYKQEELKELMLKKGFRKCFYKDILGGVVAIHIAVK